MAKVPQQKEIEAYELKTIRPNNWFIVEFPFELDAFQIKSYHATDVSIKEPMEFQRVGYQRQGIPFSRPVKKPTDGYEFTITMEETEDWRVQTLIAALEHLNVAPDGTHRMLSQVLFGDIEVFSISSAGYVSGDANSNFNKQAKWVMKDCFFVGANDFNFTYNSPGKITRTLTFCCRNIERWILSEA